MAFWVTKRLAVKSKQRQHTHLSLDEESNAISLVTVDVREFCEKRRQRPSEGTRQMLRLTLEAIGSKAQVHH